MPDWELIHGDALGTMRTLPSESVDLIYMDPPFFTQKTHALVSRDRKSRYEFSDKWESRAEYVRFLVECLEEMRRLLKDTGSLFFHCDKTASHIARLALEEVLGSDNFRSEIVWTYRRWSNSSKGLMPSHQNLYFFSKSPDFKFITIYGEYSPSTNLDQILQERERDESNKSIYARDEKGRIKINGNKKGVPLADVWDIPYLNPKAKERTGYPTQKPILLMERILQIVTIEGDLILDPFMGSGSMMVAAKLNGRRAIGIDISDQAVDLARRRLDQPMKTNSRLLETGRESYRSADAFVETHLRGMDCLRVYRNSGIDALLKNSGEAPIPMRVQRMGESLAEAADILISSSRKKGAQEYLLIQTNDNSANLFSSELPSRIRVIQSLAFQLGDLGPAIVPLVAAGKNTSTKAAPNDSEDE